MARFLPNGAGEILGDILATGKNLATSGQVWYVNSATGDDAGSPRGLSPEFPVATLQQALTNAASLDIIVLMDGHTETVAAALTVTSKHLTIVGGGKASGKPTAKITDGVAGASMLTTTTNESVRWRNVYFPKTTQAKANISFVLASGKDGFEDCYVEAANNSAGYRVIGLGNTCVFRSCTFISVATLKTARAMPAIDLTSTAAPSDVVIDCCIFDGGTVGFDTHCVLENGAFSPTLRLQGRNISLLRGADVELAAGTTGYFQATTVTGGSRVNWL